MLRKKISYCRNRLFLKRYFNVETSAKEIPQQEVSSKLHIFEKTPFRNYRELTSHFLENLIYNENGLIVLNKPYGLRKEPEKQSYSNDFQPTIHPSVSNINHLNFIEALPYLADTQSIKELHLVKLPERYMSGVSILSSDEIVPKKIKKCFAVSVEPVQTYLAICVGIPKQKNNFEKIGIMLQTQNNTKKVIFVQNYSNRSLERELVTPLVVRHSTLSVNEDLKIALVQLTINRNKWHSLRLYCATRLFAPCLGDLLMGSRVKYINNVPVLVDPFHPGIDSTQTISNDILTALQIARNDQKSIPLHLHLSQVNLPRYNRSGKTFIAKPPVHFLWTCEQLGISVPEFYLQNSELPFTEPPQCDTLK